MFSLPSARDSLFVALLLLASLSISLILPADAIAQTKSKKIVIGPGGRPLRTSYPGTPESLRASTISNETLDTKEQAKIEQEMDERQRLVNYSELRSHVRANKTRIALMNEALLFNGTNKPRLYVRFENKLPKNITLDQLDFFVDKAPQPFLPNPNQNFQAKAPFPLFFQDLTPGTHTVAFTAITTAHAEGTEQESGVSDYISGSCDVSVPVGMNAFLSVIATYSDEAKLPVLSCQLNLRPTPPAPVQPLSAVSDEVGNAAQVPST